jgi:hypothetical protein
MIILLFCQVVLPYLVGFVFYYTTTKLIQPILNSYIKYFDVALG